ncbi:hypothetical protein D9M71_537110 [compost metagenome]
MGNGRAELLLPMDPVGKPLGVLIAQGAGPCGYPLLLGGAQWPEPVIQALLHAGAALLDLLVEGGFEVFLLAFAPVLGEGVVHFGDLLVIQPLQQLDGRRGDFSRGLCDRLFGFVGAGLQGGIGDLVGSDHGLQAVQPVEIAGQLGGAVPAQVFLQALIQPDFLLAVHVQVVAERPGDDHIEIAVGQAHAAARAEGEGNGQHNGEMFEPAGHGRFLAKASLRGLILM